MASATQLQASYSNSSGITITPSTDQVMGNTSPIMRSISSSSFTYRVPCIRKAAGLQEAYAKGHVQLSQKKVDLRQVVILSPETIKMTLQNPSEELCKNLRLAREMIYDADKTIRYSPNFPLKSKVFRELATANPTQFRESVVNLGTLYNSLGDDLQANSFEEELNIGEQIAKHGLGNCFEMSCRAYKFGRGFAASSYFYLGNILGGDHGFVLVTGEKVENPADYSKWKPYFVLADIWPGAYYPALMFRKYLGDYVGLLSTSDGLLHTLVRPFNPEKQSFKFDSLDPMPQVD